MEEKIQTQIAPIQKESRNMKAKECEDLVRGETFGKSINDQLKYEDLERTKKNQIKTIKGHVEDEQLWKLNVAWSWRQHSFATQRA